MDLPECMLDYSKYEKQELSPEHLMIIINEQLQAGTAMMVQFYEKMIKFCEQDKTQIGKLQKRKYWSTASALISDKISLLLRNTCDYLINEIGPNTHQPRLLIKLIYNGKFELEPSIDHLKESITNAEMKIRHMCNDQETFESRMLKIKRVTHLKIYIGEDYLDALHDRLEQLIEDGLRDLMDYLDQLHETFEPILKEHEFYKEKNVIQDISFEEGFEKINYFQEFITKCLLMLGKEYFQVVYLLQEECKVELKNTIEMLIDMVASTLVRQHEWENRDICESFEMLANRAKQIPKTTEELMEMGKSPFRY